MGSEKIVDAIVYQHWPTFYDGYPDPGNVYRCGCGDAGNWVDHLRQVVESAAGEDTK